MEGFLDSNYYVYYTKKKMTPCIQSVSSLDEKCDFWYLLVQLN
jgi:hypothetical protein